MPCVAIGKCSSIHEAASNVTSTTRSGTKIMATVNSATPEQRYSHWVMSDNLVPFPQLDVPPESETPDKDPRRVTISMGGKRMFAIDFISKITHLNPEPAPVIPLTAASAKKKRKPRP